MTIVNLHIYFCLELRRALKIRRDLIASLTFKVFELRVILVFFFALFLLLDDLFYSDRSGRYSIISARDEGS